MTPRGVEPFSGGVASPRTTPHIVLIEPSATGHLSGGYRYNREIARSGSGVERVGLGVDRSLWRSTLQATNSRRGDVWLVDSLFLESGPFEFIQEQAHQAQVHFGVLLHALPSFVRVAAQVTQPGPELLLAPEPGELELLARADLVVLPGPYLARELSSLLPQTRFVVAYPGIEGQRSPARPSADRVAGPLQILTVGAVARNKGLLDAVEALRRLARRELRWTVIGNCELEPGFVAELKARSNTASLAVHFVGQRSPVEVRDHMARADVLLHPSYTENYPLVLVEAAAAALPVVAYAAGGVVDIVDAGVTGLLAPVGDVAQLSAHLDCISHVERRAALSRGAHEFARKLATWHQAAASFRYDVLQTIGA